MVFKFLIASYNQRVQVDIPSKMDAKDELDEIPSHEDARPSQLDNLRRVQEESKLDKYDERALNKGKDQNS